MFEKYPLARQVCGICDLDVSKPCRFVDGWSGRRMLIATREKSKNPRADQSVRKT